MSDQEAKVARCACDAIAEMPQRCPECGLEFCIDCYPIHGPCMQDDGTVDEHPDDLGDIDDLD